MDTNLFTQSVGNAKTKAFGPVSNIMRFANEITSQTKSALDVVRVPLMVGADGADVEDYTALAGSQTYINVTLHRLAGAKQISPEDVEHGATLESRVSAALEALKQKVDLTFRTAIATSTNTHAIGALSSFDSSDVPALYGEIVGSEKYIGLTTPYFSNVLASTADGLIRKSGDSGFGFSAVEEVQALSGDATFKGFLGSRNGLAIASAEISEAHYSKDPKVINAVKFEIPELGNAPCIVYVMSMPTNHNLLVVAEMLFGVALGQSDCLVKLV